MTTPKRLEHTGSVIISTAISKNTPSLSEDVMLISSKRSDSASLETLEEGLKEIYKQRPSVNPDEKIDTIDMTAKCCIFLDDIDGSSLSDLSSQQFSWIQGLCKAKYLLWVVQGASDGSFLPESNLAIGLARSVRNESDSIKIVTLDLDAQRQPDPHLSAEMILVVIRATLSSSSLVPESDNEYIEKNGRIHIPRLVNNADMNKYIAQQTGQVVLGTQPFIQMDRALRLAQEAPGNLDTLYYVDDDEMGTPLEDGYVEIQVRATGLGFHDMLTATGKTLSDRFGGECSGVITKVGKNVGSRLREGDRVCALVKSGNSTLAQCPFQLAVKVPNSLSFDSAASIPVAFSTAYHSLIKLARLAPRESVLIHSAAGGIGQAAVSIAQMIGANAFVTVSNDKKKTFLSEKYKLPEDCIISSRDLKFSQDILDATKNRAVDVVLHSMAGKAFGASWQCLTRFGRFIDIIEQAPLLTERIEMAKSSQNRAYFAIDLK